MASPEAPPGSLEANGNTLDSKLESPSTTTGNNNNLNVKGAEGTTLATTPRGSVEDLSEYTDADESVSSAPTEFLAEFLSAVMMKDYEKALKYCKLILQYEPNNATAQEFYPLIVEKIQLMSEQEYSNGNSTSSTSSSDENASADSSSDSEEKPSGESDTDATTASYSSLEDEEADFEKHEHHNDNSDVGNGNKIVTVDKHISNPAMVSISSNKKDMVPAFQSTSSDSESPTEPVSQPTIAQLQSKFK